MRGYGQNPNYLFGKGGMYAVIEHQGKATDQAIDQLDENRMLNTPTDDLADFFFEKYKIDGLKLLVEQAHVAQQETEIEIDDPFADYRFDGRGGTRTAPGTLVELTLPFEGDKILLDVQPNTYTSMPPRGIIKGDTILIHVKGRQLSPEQVKNQLDAEIANIKQYVGWQAPDINGFNDQLRARARQRIEARKAKLLRDRNLVASLGFAMTQRPDATKTYAAPSIRKKIEPRLPPASTAQFKPEPTLDERTYDDILTVMDNMTTMMERSPKAFAHMGEEQLRDHYLVQLNGRYEGNATGETFNYSGKTDISIRSDGRCIFIAECKFWKGEKAFLETVDQLLGYLSWRDTKTAVVMFNRNQNMSAVLAKVQEAMSGYQHRKHGPERKSETKFRYVCANPADRNREVIVTVMVFDIPSPATT